MIRFGVIALLLVTFCMPSAGVADESTPSGDDYAAVPKVSLLAETMLTELDFESRSKLFHPEKATAFSNESLRPIADVDFADSSFLARARKLRGLSLLTVAEVGDGRLYLGVNDDGLVGLHFGAFLRTTKSQHLEMFRMPYLDRH